MMKFTKGVESATEALALNDLLGRLGKIDLADLAAEKRAALSPVQRLVADLTEDVTRKVLKPKLKSREGVGRKPKLTRKQWKLRRKLYSAREMSKARAKRNAEFLYMLEEDTPKALWKWFSRKSNTSWSVKDGWEITLSEFEEHIYPSLGGRIPVITRYSTKKPWTVENTFWVDTETRAVLFCGKEWKLQQRGYVVTEDLVGSLPREELFPMADPEDIFG